MLGNIDQFKNDLEEVKNMNLLPTASVITTKLASMDHTNKQTQWNRVAGTLDDQTFKWHCANTTITSERICQLPVVIVTIRAKCKNTAGVEKL